MRVRSAPALAQLIAVVVFGFWVSPPPLREKSAWRPLALDNGGMGSLYRSQHELIFVFKHGRKTRLFKRNEACAEPSRAKPRKPTGGSCARFDSSLLFRITEHHLYNGIGVW